ncbi:hypothetical protein BGZ92_008759 [Podila epicladia]|nr:hypothetical protein BGZ92_008759 [Podila epicladia]
MSSVDMDTREPLELSPGDRILKLESLTFKQRIVPRNTLVDVLAVSPRLQELVLIAVSTLDPPRRSHQKREQRVRFFRKAGTKL